MKNFLKIILFFIIIIYINSLLAKELIMTSHSKTIVKTFELYEEA